MKKLAVCISGFGSNLGAIIDACKRGTIKAEIVLVACNRKDAHGLKRAQDAGIKTFVSKDNRKLFDEIEKYYPDLIILAGFMKIIEKQIVDKFYGRIINIHPSLLPEFPGLKSIQRAYNNNVKNTGVTVHYVDSGIDTGEIISQVTIPIPKNISLEQLELIVHETEHKLYPKVIEKLLKHNPKLA